MNSQYVNNVTDLTNPEKNVIYNMTHEEAVNIVRSGDVNAVRSIDGQFSLVSVEGKTIRMARSIGRPIRYFIAKRPAGPELVIAERIDSSFALVIVFRRRKCLKSTTLKIIGYTLSTKSGTLIPRSEEHTSELQSRQYLVCR